jgi:hypothetical protein
MRRFTYNLFILLSFLAIIVAGADFVCGHKEDTPFSPATCPLCTSFQSTEFSDTSIHDLLGVDTMSVVGTVSMPDTQFKSSTTSPSCQLRAPPC